MRHRLLLLLLFCVWTASGAVHSGDDLASTSDDVPEPEVPKGSASVLLLDSPPYLPVTPEAPDILGISDVSGIYGPGAVGAWYIAILVSWLGIVQSPAEQFDTNTCIYLLGTNWAAIDIWRGIRRIGKIPNESQTHDEQFTKTMGSIAAALVVTYWGTFHALSQLFALELNGSPRSTGEFRRDRFLACGMVIPLLALGCSLFLPHKEIVPAIYFPGYAKSHPYNTKVSFVLAFSWLATRTILSWLIQFIPISTQRITRMTRRSHSELESLIKSWRAILGICLSVPFSLALVDIATVTDIIPLWLFVLALYIGCVVITIWYPGLSNFVGWTFIAFLCTRSGVFVALAYLFQEDRGPKSCFFVPCAPQSIYEEDQLYSLLMGIILFVIQATRQICGSIRRRRKNKRAEQDAPASCLSCWQLVAQGDMKRIITEGQISLTKSLHEDTGDDAHSGGR